MYLVDEIMFLV